MFNLGKKSRMEIALSMKNQNSSNQGKKSGNLTYRAFNLELGKMDQYGGYASIFMIENFIHFTIQKKLYIFMLRENELNKNLIYPCNKIVVTKNLYSSCPFGRNMVQ